MGLQIPALVDGGPSFSRSLHEGDGPTWPLFIEVLGGFRLLKAGQPVPVRTGGKVETLLGTLALHRDFRVSRETLLGTIWPDRDPTQAISSLHSLVPSLHKQLGDAIGGAPPVISSDGSYRLHVEAGVCVDRAAFDDLAEAGECHLRAGRPELAVRCFKRGIQLYRGDLPAGEDIRTLVEQQRLRASFLNLLAHVADHAFERDALEECLGHVLALLAYDPCREDAHRLEMRCYARRGQRSQALQQYRVCETVLRSEFQAVPERETTELFDRLRTDPAGV
jgi:DNA-binding SARP family transcriptional activator